MSIEVTVEYAHREWNSYDHVVHIRNYQQLQAKVAELEAEVERLKAECKEFASYAKDGTIIAAQQQMKLAAAQEEIQRMKRERLLTADAIESMHASQKDQLANAEQRVAEACAKVCDGCSSEGVIANWKAEYFASAIRVGKWRKFVKEV